MCPHSPPCPAPSAPDREAAHTVVSHPEQGWSLLCNGVVIFEDTGELLPDGEAIAPHRPTDLSAFDRPIGTHFDGPTGSHFDGPTGSHFDGPTGTVSRHDGQAPAA
jgi:Family of unknown function (DUF5999)